jgi:hypothetical protein
VLNAPEFNPHANLNQRGRGGYQRGGRGNYQRGGRGGVGGGRGGRGGDRGGMIMPQANI